MAEYKRGGEPKPVGQVIGELFRDGHILGWLNSEDKQENNGK